MSVLKKIFSKEPSLQDLKRALLEVERDRRRKQVEVRKVEKKWGSLVDRIKKARRDGNDLEVDYLWQDLRELKLDGGYLRRDARVLNLEGIALKRYIRGLERMERKNDRDGIRRLIERVRSSRLGDLLMADEINERQYLDELSSILEDAGVESELAQAEEDDPEKARFLAEIDAINAAENTGDMEAATEREAKLRAEMGETGGEESG